MSSPLSDFPIFNELPPEVRCQIWRASAPDYRLVSIKYHRSTCSYVPRISPPAIFRVNQESRHEALSIYHELRLGPVPVKDCYVDLSRDLVYLTGTDGVDPSALSNEEAFVLVLSQSPTRYRGRLPSPPPHQGAAALPALPNRSFDLEEAVDPSNLPSIRHLKIILYDLLTSADGAAMLRNLHVDHGFWSSVRRCYHYQRHRLPAHLRVRHLVLVWEHGTGPLSEDLKLKPVEGGFSSEIRIASSLRAECNYINRKDQQVGLPYVLRYPVEAKILDRGDVSGSRVIGVQ